MPHAREGGSLRLETGEDSSAQAVPDEFHGDPALKRSFLLGRKDDSHTTLAEAVEDAVRSKLRRVVTSGGLTDMGPNHSAELVGLIGVIQELAQLRSEGRVLLLGCAQQGVPLLWREIDRLVVELLEAPEALSVVHGECGSMRPLGSGWLEGPISR
jgi:hypothetical protein